MKAEARNKRNKHIGMQIIELSDPDSKITEINRFKNLSDKTENSINFKNKRIEILELKKQ